MRQGPGFAILHIVGVLALMLSLTASMAGPADYLPWTDRHNTEQRALTVLAQRQDTCCKHCTKGQPCGNICISAKAKCKSPPWCAC
jgi:hypothetical protein